MRLMHALVSALQGSCFFAPFAGQLALMQRLPVHHLPFASSRRPDCRFGFSLCLLVGGLMSEQQRAEYPWLFAFVFSIFGEVQLHFPLPTAAGYACMHAAHKGRHRGTTWAGCSDITCGASGSNVHLQAASSAILFLTIVAR